MSIKKFTIPAALLMTALSCCACGQGGGGKTEEPFDAAVYAALPELRFASFYAREEEENSIKLKMKAPFSDTFSVAIANDSALADVYSVEGEKLVSASAAFELNLEKDEVVYVNLKTSKPSIRFDVTAKNNRSQLPFDPVNVPDINGFSVNGTAGVDPLKESPISYVKRAGTKYIYSNAPEQLNPAVLNKALTRNDVSDSEVFFTFEHQTFETDAYYGYQVRNTGTEDMFVTVKNIGYQVAGAGYYLGEKEWVNFYNTEFKLPDMSKWTEGEKSSFNAWFGFCGTYPSLQFQPITYRIPAGQYMYVIGGTRADSYNRFTVSDTGDKRVKQTCQNGAVLFEVQGKAEAAFYVYTDPSEIAGDTTSHLGFTSEKERCHVGIDYEGAVVDANATWIFNDSTPAQSLPVTYTNYYKDFPEGAEKKGEPFSKIESTPHEQHRTKWYTHSNVQNYNESVGTDMTTFHTVYNGKEVVTGNDYFDILGLPSNIGNWMKDYIDTFTFVNQGDTDREITVRLSPINSGGLVVLVRDRNGKLIKGSEVFALYYRASEYGDLLNEEFAYKITVKAHSVEQIHVEYNLMANSYGTVEHEVILK